MRLKILQQSSSFAKLIINCNNMQSRLTTIRTYFKFLSSSFSSLQQPYIAPATPIKIKSLASIIQDNSRASIKDLFETDSQNLFKYGIHPAEFRLQLLTFFKYGYWQTHPKAVERLIGFINYCKQEELKLKEREGEQEKRHLDLITDYRRQISVQIIPKALSEHELGNVYLEQLSKFLEQRRDLDLWDINIILYNIDRIVFKVNSVEFNNQKDNAWAIYHAFSLLLDRCTPHFSALPIASKSTLVSISKSLRVKHLPFLEWLKRDLQKEKKDLPLQKFLSAILYLGYFNSFPYQFFYRNKDSLMSYIEAAENLSDKKVAISIQFLEIFARHRLAYCQRIINRLLSCIKQNLAASDVSQVARIFFYYSRLKCAIDHDFVTSIIERLYLFLNMLDSQHYLLIIKAVASLDYRDDVLLQKLKGYDYELFLTSLKFGCSSLGQYYKAVLEQVESSFANDPQRYYKREDEPFSEVLAAEPTKIQ